MPKVTDPKAYFKEIAAKAGLKDDVIQQVLGSDDAFKAFTDGFKPLPDYSHDLDDVRKRTAEDEKKKLDAANQEFYDKELKKYNEYVAGLDRLKKYEEVFGPIDGDPKAEPKGEPKVDKKYLTPEELDARLAARDNTYLEYLELREQHMATFGKPLDRKAFESAYKDHPEWGTLQAAYKFWVEPEMEKTREAKTKADADRRYEEGVRDGFSRRAVPTDHQPKTFSPIFDRKEDVAKMGEGEQEKHSREAFFEGLRETKTA